MAKKAARGRKRHLAPSPAGSRPRLRQAVGRGPPETPAAGPPRLRATANGGGRWAGSARAHRPSARPSPTLPSLPGVTVPPAARPTAARGAAVAALLSGEPRRALPAERRWGSRRRRSPSSVAYLPRKQRRRLLLPPMRQGKMPPPRSGASSTAKGGGRG